MTVSDAGPIPPHRRPDYDPRRRWYDEYILIWREPHAVDARWLEATRKLQDAEARLRVAELTPERMYDLNSRELQRIARALHANFMAVVEELRKRHTDIVSEELLDQRVRELEAQLAEAKGEAFTARQRVWDLEREVRQLRERRAS